MPEPKGTFWILKGLPASGKSTLAKKMVESNERLVRVNKDTIRIMLHQPWTPQIEGIVQGIWRASIRSAMNAGYDIVCDDTNGNPRVVKSAIKLAEQGCYEAVVLYVNTDIEECIRRDALRQGTECVGEEVIRRMAAQWDWTSSPERQIDPEMPVLSPGMQDALRNAGDPSNLELLARIAPGS